MPSTFDDCGLKSGHLPLQDAPPKLRKRITASDLATLLPARENLAPNEKAKFGASFLPSELSPSDW